VDDVLQAVFEKLDLMKNGVSVDRVFGEPEQVGDLTLIPVAEVRFGFGLGGGSASGQVKIELGTEAEACTEDEVSESDVLEAEDDESSDSDMAFGAGGGGGGRARPIAYIEIGPDGACVKSIMDEQKVALAGILLGVWAVGWMGLVLKTLFTPRRR